MREPTAPTRLRSWRKEHGLTVREAGSRIVVEGKPADGSTWHAWEAGKKIPQPAWMFELERITGIEPSAFYPRPDASAVVSGPAQAALL